MGFFDHLVQRKGVSEIKPQRAHIRTIERKPSPASASSTPDPSAPSKSRPRPKSASASASASPSPSRPTTTNNRSSSSRSLAARAASNGVRKIPLSSAHSRASRTANDALPSPRINELKRGSSSRAASISRSTSSSSIAANGGSNNNGNGTPFTTTSTTATSTAFSSSATVTANANATATTTSRIRKRPSTYDQPLSSDSSDNDASSDVDMALEMRKRTKMSVSVEPDFKRRIKMPAAFNETDSDSNSALRKLKFVHADDISSSPAEEFDAAFVDAKAAKNVPRSKWARVEMQYPSACPRERYALVVPHDDDGFKPIDDIVRTVDAIAENYIPHTHLSVFDDPSTGLKRRFRRALAHASQSEFCETLADYNKIISKMRKDGVVSAHLDTIHALPLSLVERILTQIYARTVSPRVETLKRYENGSDNVYGELLPRFITDIFKQTRLKSGQTFVDLGSGVGNVVLQAALEIGCESWGCEMMANACDLAELQQREFEARCVLWGIAPGSVHLVRGDFLKEDRIIDVLRRADVVLINNQAFTPQLNDKITNLFLEMKEGVQIVSLKPFVPAGHKITARNLNNPINLLSVRRFEYWSEYVSWTDAGGYYYIATKDSQHLRRFAERMRG